MIAAIEVVLEIWDVSLFAGLSKEPYWPLSLDLEQYAR